MRRLVERAIDERITAINYDRFLEVTVRLCIARAAEQYRTDDDVGTNAWKVVVGSKRRVTDRRMPLCVVSQDGEFECSITKGALEAGWHNVDRLLQYLDRVGIDRRGHQPDVALRFHNPKDPESDSIFVLGDAKHKAKEGADYIRQSSDKAAVYLLAFGHPLGGVGYHSRKRPFRRVGFCSSEGLLCGPARIDIYIYSTVFACFPPFIIQGFLPRMMSTLR